MSTAVTIPEITHFPISVEASKGVDPALTIRYGQEVKRFTSWNEAAAYIGGSILHALHGEGLLDGVEEHLTE